MISLNTAPTLTYQCLDGWKLDIWGKNGRGDRLVSAWPTSAVRLQNPPCLKLRCKNRVVTDRGAEAECFAEQNIENIQMVSCRSFLTTNRYINATLEEWSVSMFQPLALKSHWMRLGAELKPDFKRTMTGLKESNLTRSAGGCCQRDVERCVALYLPHSPTLSSLPLSLTVAERWRSMSRQTMDEVKIGCDKSWSGWRQSFFAEPVSKRNRNGDVFN